MPLKKPFKQKLLPFRSSCPEVFLIKGVLKTCSKFAGDHPSRSVISIKLLCNFIEITFWHGCSPVNLLHISRTPFSKNSSVQLLLTILLYLLLTLHFVPQTLSKKLKTLKFYLKLEILSLNTILKMQ